jgi:lysophospholipase L1-like esterase
VGAEKTSRLWLRRIGLSAGSVLVFALAVEAVVRIAGLGPERWARPRHLERDDKRYGLDAYPSLPAGAWDVDLRDAAVRARWRALGVHGVDAAARRTPFAVALEYDERLCRGAAPGPRDPAVPRVLVIGDSFAEGQGVPGRDTFSSVLGRALPGPVEVINCGRRGHDFPEIHERLDRLLDLDPDVVVYAMVLNDPVQSPEFRARQAFLDDWILDRRRMLAEGDEPPPPGFWELRSWALAREAIEQIRVGRETLRWYRDMYGPPNRAGWAATQEHVAGMHAEVAARRADFLVALLPLLIGLDGPGGYPFDEESREIAAAFESRGVPFHDVTPALLGRRPADLWVHPADRHPNARAHRLIGEDLAPVVARILEERRRRR